MPKITDLPNLTSITSGAVWPVVENNIVQKISFNNFKSAINTPATSNALGTVKIGEGIVVDTTGVISVITPVASNNTVGGVKVATGSNLTVNGSGVLALSNDITFGNNSKIKATETDILEIKSTLIDINTGEDQFSSGEITIRTSDLLGSSITIGSGGTGINMQGTVYATVNGNLTGGVDGWLVGNIYEPGYDGSQTPIFNATTKTANLNKVVVGDICIGGLFDSGLLYSNFISTDDTDLRLVVGNNNKVITSNIEATTIAASTATLAIINAIDENSIIQVNSPIRFTKNLILPSYTVSERDMVNWQGGEIIINTTVDKVQVRLNNSWVDLH